MRMLIIGCGYLGRRVATIWKISQHRVTALTRSRQHADELSAHGIEPMIGDVTDPQSISTLPTADVVLYAVGFDRTAGHSQHTVYVDGLRNVLSSMEGRFGRLIYISSTSVYGQHEGEWIDEESPTVPTAESGKICLEAEELVRRSISSNESKAVLLRLAGIYGPGRLLRRIEAIKSETPVAGNPRAWLNLIHADDAASAICTLASGPSKQSTYLVCDSRPITRQSYYSKLADLVGAPPPEFDESVETSSRVAGLGKRCRNRRLLTDLNIELEYPSIEEGLPHSIRNIE